jgi:serine/threonine protein kinase
MDEFIRDYRIMGTLGEGGMAYVFKAFDPSTNRAIALKLLKKEYSSNAFYRDRFLGEAKAAGHLSHPNIVTIYSVSKDDDEDLFIAMECLYGNSLADLMRSEDRLSYDEVIQIGLQLADALDYAHSNGVIHRDIKPSNIIFFDESNQHIKITDFGIAHVDIMGQPSLTQTGTIMGTPDYMSPEQAKGEKIGKGSDLFSTGLILYELLSKHKPFHGDAWGTRYKQIVEKTPKSIQSFYPDIPKVLWTVVRRLLEKSPEKRFQSGNELGKALTKAHHEIHGKQKRDKKSRQFDKSTGASPDPQLKRIGLNQRFENFCTRVKNAGRSFSLSCSSLVNNTVGRFRRIALTFYLKAICTSLILVAVNGVFYYVAHSQQQNVAVQAETTSAVLASVISQSVIEDIIDDDWVAAETRLDTYRQNADAAALIQALYLSDADDSIPASSKPRTTDSKNSNLTAKEPIMINGNIEGYVNLQMATQQGFPADLMYPLAALNVFCLAILMGLFAATEKYLRTRILEVSEKMDRISSGQPVSPISFTVGGALGTLMTSLNRLLNFQRANDGVHTDTQAFLPNKHDGGAGIAPDIHLDS